MVSKIQAEEILRDFGYSLNPLQYYVGVIPFSNVDGYIYIGNVSGVSDAAGGILCRLRGTIIYQAFATVAQANSPLWFTIFDETGPAQSVMFSGYRMKI